MTDRPQFYAEGVLLYAGGARLYAGGVQLHPLGALGEEHGYIIFQLYDTILEHRSILKFTHVSVEK